MTETSTTTGPAQGQESGAQAERDMLYKIAIDDDGRYADKLNDIAVGYAAAQGRDMPSARNEIEQKFETAFGQSPHEYLDQHYAQRRSNGKHRERGNGRAMAR